MNATGITTISPKGRVQDAANRMGRDERTECDEEAGHSQGSAYLSRWASGTSGPCLFVCLPRKFKLDMSDEESRRTNTPVQNRGMRIILNLRSVVRVMKMHHDKFFCENHVLTSYNVEIRKKHLANILEV